MKTYSFWVRDFELFQLLKELWVDLFHREWRPMLDSVVLMRFSMALIEEEVGTCDISELAGLLKGGLVDLHSRELIFNEFHF